MIDDMFYLVGGGFVLAVSMIVVILISVQLGQVSDSVGLEAADNATMHNVFARFPNVFDSMVTFIIIGLMVISLALLFYIPVSPIIFFIVIVLSSIAIIIAGFLANAWNTIVTSDTLSATATLMPKTNFILSHYVAVTMFYLILAMIIFFSKPQGADGGP